MRTSIRLLIAVLVGAGVFALASVLPLGSIGAGPAQPLPGDQQKLTLQGTVWDAARAGIGGASVWATNLRTSWRFGPIVADIFGGWQLNVPEDQFPPGFTTDVWEISVTACGYYPGDMTVSVRLSTTDQYIRANLVLQTNPWEAGTCGPSLARQAASVGAGLVAGILTFVFLPGRRREA